MEFIADKKSYAAQGATSASFNFAKKVESSVLGSLSSGSLTGFFRYLLEVLVYLVKTLPRTKQPPHHFLLKCQRARQEAAVSAEMVKKRRMTNHPRWW